VITIVEIASNASFVFDKSWYTRKAKATNKGALLYPSFIRSKERTPMKKYATPKCNGFKRKTSDERRGNPKTQEAQKKDLR
jgi:hypothetical protein